jgi:hypothetical protein
MFTNAVDIYFEDFLVTARKDVFSQNKKISSGSCFACVTPNIKRKTTKHHRRTRIKTFKLMTTSTIQLTKTILVRELMYYIYIESCLSIGIIAVSDNICVYLRDVHKTTEQKRKKKKRC